LPVRVELTGAWTRGQTVVDRRAARSSGALDHEHDPHGLAPALVDVALSVDGPRHARVWLDAVGREGPGDSGPPSGPRLSGDGG
jgi:pyrimidine-specific ribonucleoside hydrolase